jgi:ssDNA-binding Zn-finger/Zn-ribbon topoisomerase 1
LILDGSTVYKMFYVDDLKISKTFTISPSGNLPLSTPLPNAKGQQKALDAVELDIQCPKCGKRHKINGYMDINSQQIKSAKLPTNQNVKDNDILVCDNCNFALDLKPIKNQVESQTKRKVSFK